MNYTDQIKNDMYVAMKSGDKIKTNLLRTLLSALKEKQIEKKEPKILSWEYYVSFICIIPIELNIPTTTTGTHAERGSEILFVWPKANDKSLK